MKHRKGKREGEMHQSTKRNLALRAPALALLFALSGTGLYACRENKAPLERVGENVDESANDAKRAVEDAAD
jgi:hypothetical protein